MNRRLKRNIVTLATFFVMILLFCVRIAGEHAYMIFGLLFIIGMAFSIVVHNWQHIIVERKRSYL